MLKEVHGQDHALLFLKRVATLEPSMPLLLIGEEGTGRRFACTHLAKEAFCSGTKEPGCTCIDCVQIGQHVHPDFIVLTPEGDKDIGIDAIRDVLEQATSYPSMAPVKMFVLDGADRLTVPAANALLKTLEEPPRTTRFLLLAEKFARVLPTIRSRCGRINFARLPEAVISTEVSRFEKNDAKALVYARIADGSIGRAVRHWGAGSLRQRDQVLTWIELALSGDFSSLFSQVDTMNQHLSSLLRFLDQVIHDLLMVRVDPTRMINVDASERLSEISSRMSDQNIQRLRSGALLVGERASRARINLAFHVKTLFLEAFQGN
jgi:DNA polymerase-3 subunit delta'